MSSIHRHRLSGTGAVLMAVSVGMGAFGAHLLKDIIEADLLLVYKTGVMYALIHALAMVIWPTFKGSFTPKNQKVIWQLLLAGWILFSVSLWGMGIGDALDKDWKFLGAITPFGGISWIIAWLMMGIALLKRS